MVSKRCESTGVARRNVSLGTIHYNNTYSNDILTFQISHYKEIPFSQKRQILEFNLGVVSSVLDVGNSNASSQLQFDIFIDVSRLNFDDNKTNSASNLENNTATTVTQFTVPQETACFVHIETEYGKDTIHFINGRIQDRTGNSIQYVSNHMDHVLLTYRSAASNVSFRCICMNPMYSCSSKYRHTDVLEN